MNLFHFPVAQFRSKMLVGMFWTCFFCRCGTSRSNSSPKGVVTQKYCSGEASWASDILFSFPSKLIGIQKDFSIVFMRVSEEECAGYLRLGSCRAKPHCKNGPMAIVFTLLNGRCLVRIGSVDFLIKKYSMIRIPKLAEYSISNVTQREILISFTFASQQSWKA